MCEQKSLRPSEKKWKPDVQTAWRPLFTKDLSCLRNTAMPALARRYCGFRDLNEKDVMYADFALIDNTAVQVRQRAFDFELSGLPSMPNMVFEAFFGREVGQSGKVFGNILLAVVERVDTQIAVARRMGMMADWRLMHSMTVGGSSVTAVTAVKVMP